MIFRLLYAVIYSVLVVILTGLPQAALAVVSCQDTINPNTSIRYSDALVSFKAYNGKTYAVAKSAANGGTSEAETFFDFTANITRAYAMTGDATGSLKNLLSLGQYGAAKPVRIDSAAIQQFILTLFGKYLGTANTPQSTYIDAWKEFGSGGFSALDGTALSYTNWALTLYTGQEPQAVVMGGDGKWTSGLDGVRTAQIVQFDGTLDCAVSFPAPGSGTTTSPPPAAAGGPDLSKPVCGQDLNGNGYAADPGEIASCLQTVQGLFCPVGAVSCVETYSAPICPTGSVLDAARDMCQASAVGTCASGYSYNPSLDKCEAVPSCTGDGIYNTKDHSCFLGMNTCPLGNQYACMSNNGTMQCSPNQCFTAGTSGTEQTTTMNESMMQDDGQRDQNGSCLDQLYVFNGKSSRCRPPGLTVGMINNCCESDSVGSDDMGSNISMVANGIQAAYEIGQVAYYSYLVGTGAATVTPLVGTASVGIVTASGATTVSGAVASGVSAAAASGTTGAAAVGTAMEAYVGALLNPATIAVAVVVVVVMRVLMGGGCDPGDIQTGMQAASKDCHYIGDYCEKTWPLAGCVQNAKGYCCFNTKMARIIHEQGRPQLLSFGVDGGWGTPRNPNCRGFTPDEFQALDFSRIDLSEYFGDIQKDLATKIQGAQTTIQNKLQQKIQATTGAN